MAVQTLPLDEATCIIGPEGQAELLADAFASGNRGYNANALGIIARTWDVPGCTRHATPA